MFPEDLSKGTDPPVNFPQKQKYGRGNDTPHRKITDTNPNKVLPNDKKFDIIGMAQSYCCVGGEGSLIGRRGGDDTPPPAVILFLAIILLHFSAKCNRISKIIGALIFRQLLPTVII